MFDEVKDKCSCKTVELKSHVKKENCTMGRASLTKKNSYNMHHIYMLNKSIMYKHINARLLHCLQISIAWSAYIFFGQILKITSLV
jgi:hypothetical protein